MQYELGRFRQLVWLWRISWGFSHEIEDKQTEGKKEEGLRGWWIDVSKESKLVSLVNVSSWETKMYKELSSENIKGYENELDERLEGTLALKLDW